MTDAARPPIAKRVPTERTLHGETVVDEYAWLRRRDDPDTIAYLEAENAYTDAVMAPWRPLQERIFEEIRSRVQETDESAPVPRGDWEYFVRTVEGLQYDIHCRRPRGGGTEEVLLDENALAEGEAYLSVGAFRVSPDHRRVAYAVDTRGDITYTVHVKDLVTGELLPDVIENVYGGVEWTANGEALLYTVIDDAHRSWRLLRHCLGASVGDDSLLYQEDDERFWVWLAKSRDGHHAIVHVSSKVTSEAWLLDVTDPAASLRLVEPRRQDVEYQVEVHRDRLFIVTNQGGAENFKLMETPLDAPGAHNWREVLAHRPDVKIEHVDAFARHLVVYEIGEALQRIRVLDLERGTSEVIEQPEHVYSATPGANLEFDASVLRYTYTSLVTPPSDIDLDMATGARVVVKQEPVLGGYDPADFETTRLWAKAPDGERVPMSVVHRRGLELDGAAPAILYGYGSYEDFYEPSFSSIRLTLLERGWVVAIAHVRGGGELGRRWYDAGKMLQKPNTFSDFVACADHLVAQGYTSSDRLTARGGSAGGLLVGAAVNMRPDLFRAVVARVPFVDVINTMLDQSLPLTVIEWEEWGNPGDPGTYACMRTYAPYENVTEAAYPDLLVTAGINDSQVQYWEPAKWVARLRALTTGTGTLLLKTEMGAGHAGPSGRYDTWREEAFILAFLLRSVGAQVEH